MQHYLSDFLSQVGIDQIQNMWPVFELDGSLETQLAYYPPIGITLSPGSPDETRPLSAFITTCVAS